jgi:D-sedoheptulose 7-phosphate isomerase
MLARHIAELHQDLETLGVHEAVLTGLGDALLAAFRNGNKLMTCGNGGSAAEAAHLAEEFTGRFYRERGPFPGMCLSIDGSVLTCIGNDYSFDEVFARQVRAFAKPGDVLVGFTTSGNSENVIRAVTAARECGVITCLFSGKTGGRANGLADFEIVVRSVNPSSMRIQECHQLMLHALCDYVERALLGVED